MRAAMYYDTAPMAMTLEVYASDAAACGAAAALAAERLGAAGARATVALAGGRSGRGVMVALAARGDLPWERVEWFWGDERCVPADDGRSNLRLQAEIAPPVVGGNAALVAPEPLDALPRKIAARRERHHDPPPAPPPRQRDRRARARRAEALGRQRRRGPARRR